MYHSIIIAGGRDFNDMSALISKLDEVLIELKDSQLLIVSGTARGADKLGEEYAKSNGYHVKRFPPDWNTHGKAAGFIRNAEMAKFADVLVAFWDGKSKGTKHMIDIANKEGLKVFVQEYQDAHVSHI